MNPKRLSKIACAAFMCTICMAAAAMPQTATKPATTPDEPPNITLLKPGDAPRNALRFHVSKGATATMEMIMRMSRKITMDQGQMPDMKLPPMRFVMRMNVTEVQPNGDFAYEFNIADAGTLDESGSDPQMLDMLQAQLKPIIGVNGRGEMTNRGILKSADMNVPANMSPAGRQQLESVRKAMRQMVVPLPEEPIGPGGQWKVEQRIAVGGIKFAQTFTTTLNSVQGDRVEMSLQVTQSADPQDVTAPDVPQGTHLTSLSSKGEGKISLDLGRPLMPRSQADSATDVVMEVPINGDNHLMNQHLDINVTWQEAKATTTQPATKPAGSR